ncbi:amidohydrolase [Streptomyces gamaensis]|uniref:Amidohydrolase n=1 Tax=Streptomyces gamaensis TaxID=1763542 RepID=A0ABW0Z1N5_9ACTN
MTSTMPVGGIRPGPGVPDPAGLVVRNARIHTGDPRLPAASAVAVRDGVFVAVGDDADIAAHVGPDTTVVDALGRRVIPGLIDSHLHVIRGGLNYLLELRWDGVTSLRQGLRMLREQVERTPKGQWVRVVGGWSKDQFTEKRLPTPAELTAVAPDTPVFVLHLYQAAVLNRAAVTAVGHTRDTPDPPGGQIVRDHAGNPTGMLLAAPAAGLLYATLAQGPSLSPPEQVSSTRHFLRELNRFGLTGAVDAAGGFQNFPDNYGVIMDLARAGELTVRIAYHLFPQTPGQELRDLERWTGMVSPGDGDAWLRCNGAGENLAWSPADFENFAEPRPELEARAQDDLEAAVRLLMTHGWGFRLHATYDETIQQDLDVFDKLAAEGLFPRGTSWFFDHAETVSEANLDRIKALGGALSVQNRMMFQGRAFIDRYGAARAQTAPPVRAMLDRGLTVAAGTDATRVSSYNPWLSLAWLVGGFTVDGGRLNRAADRVDRETALRMYTLAGAELTGEADVKGTVEVGKYADLAVLSADYFGVDEADIARIESLLTVVGGRVVHGTAEYEGLAAPPPPVLPAWSPVARFGGYRRGDPDGVVQARHLLDAVAESEEHLAWRRGRGEAVPEPPPADPLGGCF